MALLLGAIFLELAHSTTFRLAELNDQISTKLLLIEFVRFQGSNWQ